MKKNGWISLFLGLALTGCNLPQPTPPTPTITPGPSPTATATITPSPTPTLPPTPTTQPQARILAGQNALAVGDYFSARDEYKIALDTSPDEKVRAEALWGLGRLEFLAGDYALALSNLRKLVEEYPSSEPATPAWCLLGETYFSLGRYEEAEAAYQKYLSLRPGLIDGFVQIRRGDSLAASGRPADAIQAYEAALLIGAGDPVLLKLEMGKAYAAMGDHANAIKFYEEVSVTTQNDYTKALVDYLWGQSFLALGDREAGYGKWRHAVQNYPLAYDSYLALVGLVNDGQEISEFDRGLVDYFAKQYGVALAAFDRYIQATPGHDGTAIHYQALSYRELGDYPLAIQAWDALIEKYPENRYWAAAWDEKATTQWAYMNQYEEAAQTLLDFVAKVPESIVAPAYMMDAARIYERSNDLEKAASLWETLAGQYPHDDLVPEALFQAAIASYRLGNYARALENLEHGYPLLIVATEKARYQLWVGKSHAMLGQKDKAQEAWKLGQSQDPAGYYSLRARDMLLNRQPFQAAPSYKFDHDLAAERKKATEWMMVRFGLPEETNLNDLGKLKENASYKRGMEFWNLGLYDQARAEFESLRLEVQTSAVDSFRLGNFLIDLGLYRPGIFALRQVLTLAGLESHAQSLTAPAYFRHARYGLYYRDLIFPAAEEHAFDPLFITSLVRQESLFEGFVRSSANAHGLMQIIPPTGASVAEQMGWPPNYNSEMLYSPYVSVRMGTFYLASNRRLMEGDLYAALAAYNGGPGNAAIWKSLSGNDPDLFLEVIRFRETRNYIRGIYEIYDIYRSTYSLME